MRCSDTDLLAGAAELGELLTRQHRTVATAESCTGGWIAKVLTDVPGSSGWFGTGIVSYSNRAKTVLLGVDAALLERHGAVSEPVVRAMLAGCLARSGADLGVAVSGIAGPGGGSVDKPVGTVWIAWGSAAEPFAARWRFDGDRTQVRRQTVAAALDALLGRPHSD